MSRSSSRLCLALVLVVAAVFSGVGIQSGVANADATGTGGDFVSVAYSRLFETTVNSTPFAAGETRSFQVLGVDGIPATGVGAIVMDVSAWKTTATSSNPTGISVWPSTATRPSADVLRVDSNNVPRSNTVVVAPGPDGKVSFYNSAGSTDLNVDIQGYFTSSSSSGSSPGGFVPLNMTRVIYTDDGTGTSATPIAANGGTRTVTVAGVGAIPSSASSVFANVHVHNATADGKIKIVAYGSDVSASNPILNYAVGAPTDSGATLPLGGGKLTIQNNGDSSVDVAIDVEGYFSADPSQGGGYQSVTPTKLASITIPANRSANVTTAGQAGLPSTGVSGMMMSFTATGGSGSGLGYLKAYPADQGEPIGAILGWASGNFEPVSTSAVVSPSYDGKITLSNIGDNPITITPTIEGWFAGDPPVPSTTLNGYARYADGTPMVGAQVRLWIEQSASSEPADGTIGSLLGPITTSSTGAWSYTVNRFPANSVRNPDGTVVVDGEVTSSDGTYDKLFNFNIAPATWNSSATMGDAVDGDLKVAPLGPTTGLELSMTGSDPTIATTPNTAPVEEVDMTDSASAYAAASADDADESAVPGGPLASKRHETCDGHDFGNCWITGDPGPCTRAGEVNSYWAKMPGDSNINSRWVPVQGMWTQAFGHEKFRMVNESRTEMSVAYTGYGRNFKGGLSYSSDNGNAGANSASAGHNNVGYFKAYWQYRKYRQWCSEGTLGPNHSTVWRDTGKRKWRPEEWLGGMDKQDASVSWPCNKAYDFPMDKKNEGDALEVTTSASTGFSKFFSIAGVDLDSHQINNSSHTLSLWTDSHTWWCPDGSETIFQANKVQEE